MNEKQFDLVLNIKAAERREDISFLCVAEVAKARCFHKTFPVYKEAPLVFLQHLAEKLQIKRIIRILFGAGNTQNLKNNGKMGENHSKKKTKSDLEAWSFWIFD